MVFVKSNAIRFSMYCLAEVLGTNNILPKAAAQQAHRLFLISEAQRNMRKELNDPMEVQFNFRDYGILVRSQSVTLLPQSKLQNAI